MNKCLTLNKKYFFSKFYHFIFAAVIQKLRCSLHRLTLDFTIYYEHNVQNKTAQGAAR